MNKLSNTCDHLKCIINLLYERYANRSLSFDINQSLADFNEKYEI